MRRSIALIATLSLSVSLFAADTRNRVSVPRVSDVPVIDGTMGPNEWRGATRIALSYNQGHAMLLQDGNYLYVAIVGAKPGIGSLCVRGKTGVRVLHASAALGTAAFELEKGKWTLTRGFTWTNRDTGDSPAAMDDRKKMLSTDGWFANTSRAAMKEREYQIPIRGQKEVALTLGFYAFTPEEQRLYHWPIELEDDCADPELAGGATDREYTFDPSKWGVLVMEQ